MRTRPASCSGPDAPTRRRRLPRRTATAFLAALLALATLLGGCDALARALGLEGSPTPTAAPTPFAGEGPLRITEVVSDGVRALVDADGASPDWIEIGNSGSAPVGLEGLALSDDPQKPLKWLFPDVTIPAGGFLVVRADGSSGEDVLRAPFRLDSDGETLVLTDAAGRTLDRVDVPALLPDVSYGRTGAGATGDFAFFGTPSPGKANDGSGAATAAEAAAVDSDAAVSIREVMVRNGGTLYDEDGDTPDWAEIANDGAEAVDLAGFGLSTDAEDPFDWMFPAGVSIPAGGCLVVLLDAGEKPYDAASGRIHASFRLGDRDAELRLVDRLGRTADAVALEATPADVSKGRRADDPSVWAYFPLATPGTPNATVPFASLQELLDSAVPTLRTVVFSEVSAIAAADAEDGAASADWIELRNASSEPVDLAGYGLSDDPTDLYRQTLPAGTLAPGAYLAVPASFGVSSDGTRLFLTRPDGATVDVFETARLRPGTTCGRSDAGVRALYGVATPGRANAEAAYAGYAAAVSFLVDRGGASASGLVPDDGGLYCEGKVRVALACAQPGAAIHYTLDGSAPTAASPTYDGAPLVLEASTAVRAVATCDGCLPGFPTTRTFLFDAPHDLPVVCLVSDPDGFFSEESGIWVHYYKDWERPMNFAFYETDGTLGTSFDGGVRLNGDTSRKQDQKSMEILLKDAYGPGAVTYPFFEGLDVRTFHRLVLRTSGQDWKYTHLRDAFMTEVVDGAVDLSYAAVRRCAVYLNGRYWGLYEIREKLDRFYFASHFGVDPEAIDLVKGDGIPLEGSRSDYQALLIYARDHDLTVPENYAYVTDRLDETSLMDFLIVYSFFTNRDTGNKKVWRQTSPSTEYRFCMYDFDWALFPTTYTGDLLANDLFDPEGHGAYDLFKTWLQVGLVENPLWRDAFVARYREMLDTAFATDRMLAILDRDVAEIETEMPRQIARWPSAFLPDMKKWRANIAQFRAIVESTNPRMREALDRFAAEYGAVG